MIGGSVCASRTGNAFGLSPSAKRHRPLVQSNLRTQTADPHENRALAPRSAPLAVRLVNSWRDYTPDVQHAGIGVLVRVSFWKGDPAVNYDGTIPVPRTGVENRYSPSFGGLVNE